MHTHLKHTCTGILTHHTQTRLVHGQLKIHAWTQHTMYTQLMHGPVGYVCIDLNSTNEHKRYQSTHIWLEGSGIYKTHTFTYMLTTCTQNPRLHACLRGTPGLWQQVSDRGC